AGVGLTFFSWLPLIVLGLACVATAMFTGYTATQLGVSDVARAARGAASALYFSTYYGAGALGAFLPGLAWEDRGWNGVAWLGLATLVLAAAALALAGPSGARAGRLRRTMRV
ncbi:MAG: MFS transporter, partial [Gaiellaceae bacterium]